MKTYMLSVLCIISCTTLVLGQTNSVLDGNWNVAINWDNGVPADDANAIITNNMILTVNLKIKDNASYIVNNGSVTDNPGGPSYKVDVEDDGYFEVGGSVTIGGNLNVKDNGEVIIKACDTLWVEGKVELKDNSKLTVEECAVLIIGGDFKIEDDNVTIINGNVAVGGKLETKDDAIITGDGNIEVEDEIKIKNESSIFGSTADCNPGPCEYGSGVGLPIELAFFEASVSSSNLAELNWATVTEVNNDYFTVERMNDNNIFEVVAIINGAGNSQKEINYTFIDDQKLNKDTYYRLKQTDFNGGYTYSNTELVRPNYVEENELILYPNPVNEILNVKTTSSSNSKIYIIDTKGVLVHSMIVSELESNTSINVSSFKPGIYILIKTDKLSTTRKQFIVSH